MTNIWGFCLQTLTVSLAALLLLIVKGLLADKLSPRWQYGIWTVLALRILIPADIGRTVIVNFGVWLETGKALAERGLHSVYSGVYAPISMNHVFPYIKEGPVSVTDWLFVIYAAGVAVSLGWYLCAYIALRLRLRRGTPAGPAVMEKIGNVRLRHWLRPWKVIQLEGISSAFVCGVIRPVLVVPAGADIDEKVLLHEMLHLKYRDALQSVFWAILRCLHWCNPFLHYVFDRIGNDMESLCDQRVLERLEGEERREYGNILLTMANARYARAPGTTSISNGGKNIARRIAAIVRFKKYPRGMSLVSVCIGLVLLSPVLMGTAAAFDNRDYQPANPQELTRAMAAARVQRCSTLAGAIDTYAKGILNGNGIYIAVASPISAHEELQRQMESHGGYYLDPGYGLEYLRALDGYSIFDMKENEDGSYSCHLAFSVTNFEDPAHQDWPTDINGVEIVAGTVIIPLRVFREGDAWVAVEYADRILANIRYGQIEFYGDDMPWLAEKTVECATGTVTISHRTEYCVDNAVTTNDIFGWTNFDYSIKPDAEFSGGWLKYQCIYQMDPDSPVKPAETATLELVRLNSLEKSPEFGVWNDDDFQDYSQTTGGSNSGSAFQRIKVDENWDGILRLGGGSGTYDELNRDPVPALPAGYGIRIQFDGVTVDEFVIGGIGNE